MCDYSLEHVASREAEVGDKLVSTRIGDSITRGFTAPGSPNVAVCLRPGTELSFEKCVEFDQVLSRGRSKCPFTTARFRQIDTESKHVHHDALEFPDGRVVLVTRLVEGQHATVLQLPADKTWTAAEGAGLGEKAEGRSAPARELALPEDTQVVRELAGEETI